MDQTTRTHIENLWSTDRALQNDALSSILAATESQVDWAYEVWDQVVAHLTHKDNHDRAIAAQVLCNLAKSDPKNHMAQDFESLLAVTKDERFVTARHCLQALWKIGAVGKAQQQMVIDGLARRYAECSSEKNCTLIRFDIIQDLRNLYDAVKDETIREKALALIETEDDLKYRKKYAGVWKVKIAAVG
jgi:hypothetical protein